MDRRESNDFTLTKIHCDVPHRCMRENPYVPQEGEISQEITPLARQVPQQQWREPLPVLRLVQSYPQAVLEARGLYPISLVNCRKTAF